MATERKAPDALIGSSGFGSCALSDLTSDPDSGDANWCVATDNNTNTETHTSFGTPTGDPTVGADLQEFRAEVRQFDGGQTGTPQARIELWENGALVRAGSDVNVTSATSQVISFTWNANELGTADGSLVECKVIGTKAGGSPSARNAVDVGGVEWNVDYTSGNRTGSGTPQADTATVSGVGTNTDLGSGAAQADTATASGVAVSTHTGSGAPQADTATASGAGAYKHAASGTPQADTATASGAGLNTNLGSGAPQADTATGSGAGTVTGGAVSGSGTPQADTATVSGAGSTLLTGSGAVQADTATVFGQGIQTINGSGAVQAETATASGYSSPPASNVGVKRIGIRIGLGL